MKRFLLIGLAALVLGVAPCTAGAATTAKPKPKPKPSVCWKAVQTNWYRHGKVIGHYKLACYLTAIKKLPTDVATYSGAAQDIRKAYKAEKKRLAKIAKHKAALKKKHKKK